MRRDIARALAFDPRVRSFGIETAVAEGIATLRGTVGSRRAKQAALELARHTGGVREVVDALEVRAPSSRRDAEILADVKAALERSAALANNRVEVSVSNGRVVLNGQVESAFEKWSAEDYADRTAGVTAVENNLVTPGPAVAAGSPYYYYPSRSAQTPWMHAPGADAPTSDAALTAAVNKELEENPLTSPGDIHVSARRGAVTLEGSVGSWSARGLASNLAYEAGARAVHNQLQVRLGTGK